MRTLLTAALAVVLVPAARGQDAAKEVIEKAIQAHGGAALDKYPAGRSKSKGSIVLLNTEFPFTNERVYQMPGKYRSTFEVTSANVTRSVTYVANGDKVAAFAGGLAQELNKPQVEELKTALYAQNLTRLTPLLKDKQYKLAPADGIVVDGRPTVGVTVSSEGHKDVRLYFDRETNLLAAVERSGFDAQGKPADNTEIYSGYRETNGLKYPTKVVIKQNGKRYLESETLDFKPLERVDPKEFRLNPS
jgi:hypothetical protein